MRWFVGGQQKLMPELLALIAPTVNSDTRLIPAFLGPPILLGASITAPARCGSFPEAENPNVSNTGLRPPMPTDNKSPVQGMQGPPRPIRDGLGLLPGSNCPHYDGEDPRRPTYHRRRSPAGSPQGIAADDFCGLHFRRHRAGQRRSARGGRPARTGWSLRTGRCRRDAARRAVPGRMILRARPPALAALGAVNLSRPHLPAPGRPASRSPPSPSSRSRWRRSPRRLDRPHHPGRRRG